MRMPEEFYIVVCFDLSDDGGNWTYGGLLVCSIAPDRRNRNPDILSGR